MTKEEYNSLKDNLNRDSEKKKTQLREEAKKSLLQMIPYKTNDLILFVNRETNKIDLGHIVRVIPDPENWIVDFDVNYVYKNYNEDFTVHKYSNGGIIVFWESEDKTNIIGRIGEYCSVENWENKEENPNKLKQLIKPIRKFLKILKVTI